MANVLIIDDDQQVCVVLANAIERMDHHVHYTLTLREGLNALSTNPYDIVFLDVRLPDGDGLSSIPRIRITPSSPEIIIITGHGDPDGAELAFKSGAWDYIVKPTSIEAVSLSLVRALQYRDEKKDKIPSLVVKRERIIGNNVKINQCLDLVGQAAGSDASVLITGETGTGKELFANAIHENSPRGSKNFVVVDCASLPDALVESTLFGHEKGAFTGAVKIHEGLIKQADGGTLFLDEIGELPESIQKVFLRVLQERSFRPVGGNQEIESNFRLVAATNRDLAQMVRGKTFRQDLLFRIQSIVIDLPPLKERTNDIRELAMYFMTKFCDRQGIGTKGFSPEFIESLALYDWPGNVRELSNTILSVLSEAGNDPILFPKHLPTYIRTSVARNSLRKKITPIQKTEEDEKTIHPIESFKAFREKAVGEAEKKYLRHVMSLARWDIREACQISGLSQPRLYALLKKHDISRPK